MRRFMQLTILAACLTHQLMLLANPLLASRETQQLLYTSEDLRAVVDEWRFWFMDQPSHMTVTELMVACSVTASPIPADTWPQSVEVRNTCRTKTGAVMSACDATNAALGINHARRCRCTASWCAISASSPDSPVCHLASDTAHLPEWCQRICARCRFRTPVIPLPARQKPYCDTASHHVRQFDTAATNALTCSRIGHEQPHGINQGFQLIGNEKTARQCISELPRSEVIPQLAQSAELSFLDHLWHQGRPRPTLVIDGDEELR